MKTNLLLPKAVVIILCFCLFMKNNLNAQSENILYGVTKGGGIDGNGVIFHIDRTTGLQTVDYSWVNYYGGHPKGDITEGGNGKLYGMTSAGGANSLGIIFEWNPTDNTFKKKLDFDGTANGSKPSGSLTFGGGKFYGMTSYGGINGGGVIFEWDPTANIFTKKVDFDGTAKGSNPLGSLILSAGKFYGMTFHGGENNQGVIFEWDPVTNIYNKKVDFSAQTKGSQPHGSLTLCNGKFYGMTSAGGANNQGVIFEWNPSTNTYAIKVDFDGTTKGSTPYGSLTLSDGKLYGMTNLGGDSDFGVIFEWDPVYNIFTKKIDFDRTIKGSYPYGSLTLSGGKFYGLTNMGGANDLLGIIFEWNPADNTFIDKVDFNSSVKGMGSLDGDPSSPTPQGSITFYGGKFYGMSFEGGDPDAMFNVDEYSSFGVIFEWDPATNLCSKKIDFEGSGLKGQPYGSLSLYNGKFYGMTYYGGDFSFGGVIFEWDPIDNIYTKKVQLTDESGRYPYGSLTLKDDKFYGMTSQGGSYRFGAGDIFKWDPVTNNFSAYFRSFNTPEGSPHGSLTLSDGKLYGMNSFGDLNYDWSFGDIFELDPATNIYSPKIGFDDTITGSTPNGSLTLSGGKLYGMTSSGGVYGYGVIFEWNPTDNDFIKKIDFDGTTKGSNPNSDLTLCNGKFYGMTLKGGANNQGVIFEWDPVTNIYSKKIDFDGTTKGSNPYGSLTLSAGKFYGMTSQGGINDKGVIFEWDPVTNAYAKLLDFNGINGSSPWYTQLAPYSIEVPNIQAYNLSFSDVQTNQMTISWTNGNGSKRAVFVKEGTGPISNPTDNTTYNASTNWATKGSQLGTSGYYCMYNGSSDSITLTGLATHTLYTVQAFEYDGIPGTELYQTSTSTNNPNSRQTTTSTPVTSAGTVTICQGDTITLPITVDNFASIASVELRLDYNPLLMTYSSNTNMNSAFLGVLINDVMVSPSLHKIIFHWSDVNPVTLTNGSKLMDLNFTYMSGSPALIFNNTDNGGGDCEYADESGDPLNDNPTASFYTDGQVTINQSLPAGVSIAANNNLVCSGTSVIYTATPTNGGTTPYYQWRKNGINAGSNSTTYSYAPVNSDVITCVMTSNLICVTGSPDTSNVITMTINTTPTEVTASATPNPICESATLTLTGEATGATIWSWIGPNSFSSVLQNSEIINITKAGAGEYALTASNSCGSATAVNTEPVIVSCVGFEEVKDASIKLYPNPTNGTITFMYQTVNDQRLKDLDLYNSIGIHVKSILKGKNVAEINQQFNLQPLPNGTYFLVIRTQDEHYVLHLSIILTD